MDRRGESPEIERLHESWGEFERELGGIGIEPEQCGAVLSAFYRYRDEAVAYRLSTVDVVQELKLQIKNCYYKNLHSEWFAELDSGEVIEILPFLVPMSMHWDPTGNLPLVNFVNVALDALPRDLARQIYLDAFTKYLRGFGYYERAAAGEKERILREYMWLDRQYIFRSETARENGEALGGIIRDLLGEEALPIYQEGLARARANEQV